MAQSKEQMQKAWAKIIAKCWSDPEFKQQVISNPAQALPNAGLEVQPGLKVVVHENVQGTCHLTIPQKPQGELSEQQLSEVAVGATGYCTF